MNIMFYLVTGVIFLAFFALIRLACIAPKRPEKYPTAPACPCCGYKHPLVAEFGYCGKCASQIYGDY